MKYRREILRGDIYYASLNPVIGSEQGGIRPVLIIQNDVGNRHSPATIVGCHYGENEKASSAYSCVSSERNERPETKFDHFVGTDPHH